MVNEASEVKTTRNQPTGLLVNKVLKLINERSSGYIMYGALDPSVENYHIGRRRLTTRRGVSSNLQNSASGTKR